MAGEEGARGVEMTTAAAIYELVNAAFVQFGGEGITDVEILRSGRRVPGASEKTRRHAGLANPPKRKTTRQARVKKEN